MNRKLAIALVVLAGAACDRAPRHDQGVIPGTIMTNPPVLVTEARLTFEPRPVVEWADEGRLLLVDKEAAQAVKFDPSDGTETRFGRKGLGPGETIAPMWATTLADGGVAIGDQMSRIVILLDNRGKETRRISVPGLPREVRAGADGSVWVAWMDLLPNGGLFIGRIPDNADSVVLVVRPQDLGPEYVVSADNIMDFPPLAVDIGTDGEVIIGDGRKYRILAMTAPGAVRRFSREDLPIAPRSSHEVEAIKEKFTVLRSAMGGRSEGLKVIDQLESKEFARPRDHFWGNAIRLDESRNIWVARQLPSGTETALDRFTPAGVLSGTVTLPGLVASYAFRGDKLAVLIADPFEATEVATVRIYSLSQRP